jgi:DNA ligase-1
LDGAGWKQLKYVVFDAPTVNGGFETRLEAIKTYVEGIGESGVPYIQVHPHIACRDIAHMESEMARIRSIGGEGLMLRAKGSAYCSGRTSVLLKKKLLRG